jgi:hypothetical protein
VNIQQPCSDSPAIANQMDGVFGTDRVRTVKVGAMPYAAIPVNREVKYDVPRPVVPLEKLEMLPDLFRGDSR